jgi:dTDP-4-dehydrorhamnose reductase
MTCQAIQTMKPQVVVNATAYTQVDQAESHFETAYAVNATAPGLLAEAASKISAAFIHYSTDYVFDGMKGSPYLESDAPNPLNVYGKSKLAGEQAVAGAAEACLILRTSWVYSLRRESFVTKVLSWARQNPEMRVVEDQVGNPTWARMLAEISALLLARGGENIFEWLRGLAGVYHLAGAGSATRREWAESILKLDPHPEEQICKRTLPACTGDFPGPARRPLYSALNCDLFTTTFSLRLPPWETSLRLAMEN